MIVWSGYGFSSALLFVILFFISAQIFPTEYSDYGIILSLFITGIFSWVIGKEMNKKEIVIDKSGQRKIVENQHTLFWIPMQYWGIIFPCFGLLILLQNSLVLGIISSLIFGAIIFFQYNDYNTMVFNPTIEQKVAKTSKVKTKSTIKSKTPSALALALKAEANLPKRKELSEMTKEEQDAYHKKYMPK